MPPDQIITQADLDSLLSSLGISAGEKARRARRKSGAAVVHEARVHDFARGETLSRSMLQALESLCTSFAIAAAGRLSSYLRVRCRMALLSLDQLTYHQFKRSVPDPTVIGVLNLPNLPGQAILEVNQSLGVWIVDHLLGGHGDISKSTRPLTEIERSLMEGTLSAMVSELTLTLPDLPVTKANLVSILHSAESARIAEPTDPVIVASFELTLNDLTGMASICFPIHLFRTKEAPLVGSAQKQMIAASLLEINLPCSIQLGAAHLTVAELAQLAEGDVICLQNTPATPMQFLVSDRPKFSCRLIAQGTQVAVEIVE